MIRNYLKIAWRNLYKNKLYSMVNLAGLSIGVVGCLLIGIYIHHEIFRLFSSYSLINLSAFLLPGGLY